MFFDLQFQYSTIFRNVCINQVNSVLYITNSYAMCKITKLFLYFAVNKTEQLDHARTYNYFYLFKFFMGLKAYITNYSTMFSLGKTYYTYNVGLQLTARKINFALFFLLYELFPYVNTNVAVSWYWKNTHQPVMIYWEVNYFTEKKASAGLFDLDHPLQCEFTANCGKFTSNLLQMYKLPIYGLKNSIKTQ